MDETILPTDYKLAGQIVDDELNAMLVRPLMPGATLHVVIDACHSGTAMDLAYKTSLNQQGQFFWKVCAASLLCVGTILHFKCYLHPQRPESNTFWSQYGQLQCVLSSCMPASMVAQKFIYNMQRLKQHTCYNYNHTVWQHCDAE